MANDMEALITMGIVICVLIIIGCMVYNFWDFLVSLVGTQSFSMP